MPYVVSQAVYYTITLLQRSKILIIINIELEADCTYILFVKKNKMSI